ncbi:MAG: ABC transporter permease [Candidatus Helarchaeota archaeon]|nr:ABC transporter permease [Candidatus Helarchaeota archaeon]
MVSLKRIYKLIIKELHWLKSDKRALFMAILLPPLIMAAFSSMAILSGGEASLGGSTINVAIVTYDDISYGYTYPNGTTVQLTDNTWALKFVQTLENSSLTEVKFIFNISENVYGMLSAREHLAHKRIDAIISIPAEFSEAITLEFPAIIEVIPDGSDIMTLPKTMNNLQQVLTEFQQSNDITPYFQIDSHVEFSSGGNEMLGLMSSISVPFLIIGATLILTLLVVVKESPLSRLLMTPAKRSEILISKYITYSAVMVFQIFLIFIVNTIIGLEVAGPLFDFFIAMLLVGFYGITFGILISTISSSEIQANQYFLGIFLVSVLVSGMFIPVESMAPWLQGLAYIFPLASAVPLLSNISLKGLSLTQGPNLLYSGTLLGMSFVIILLTVIIFYRKKLEV